MKAYKIEFINTLDEDDMEYLAEQAGKPIEALDESYAWSLWETDADLGRFVRQTAKVSLVEATDG